MEIRKLSENGLPSNQALALLEIAQGIALIRPDWEKLRRTLFQYDVNGFFDDQTLIGYAKVNSHSAYFGGSVQIMELRYDWQHNQERFIAEMIVSLARSYQQMSSLLVMDVDAQRDFNVAFYQKMGFTRSVMPSPLGKNRVVLLANMESLLNCGIHA